jgi:hypothetical protein
MGLRFTLLSGRAVSVIPALLLRTQPASHETGDRLQFPKVAHLPLAQINHNALLQFALPIHQKTDHKDLIVRIAQMGIRCVFWHGSLPLRS